MIICIVSYHIPGTCRLVHFSHIFSSPQLQLYEQILGEFSCWRLALFGQSKIFEQTYHAVDLVFLCDFWSHGK